MAALRLDDRTARRLVYLVGVVVLVASVVPVPTSGPSLSGPFGLVGADKWIHALAYATLALFTSIAYRVSSPRAVVLVVLTITAFGAGIEALQWFVPTRSMSLFDLAANLLGTVGGVAVGTAIRPRLVVVGTEKRV